MLPGSCTLLHSFSSLILQPHIIMVDMIVKILDWTEDFTDVMWWNLLKIGINLTIKFLTLLVVIALLATADLIDVLNFMAFDVWKTFILVIKFIQKCLILAAFCYLLFLVHAIGVYNMSINLIMVVSHFSDVYGSRTTMILNKHPLKFSIRFRVKNFR